jgi:hypothetical protein
MKRFLAGFVAGFAVMYSLTRDLLDPAELGVRQDPPDTTEVTHILAEGGRVLRTDVTPSFYDVQTAEDIAFRIAREQRLEQRVRGNAW